MLWILIAVMLAAAVLIVAVPLYRAEKSLSLTLVVAILTITALSAALYSQIGTPNPDLSTVAEEQLPDIEEMVSSLADRLEQNPNDTDGWKMLGRSYFNLRNFPGAIAAFEKAVELESGADAQTLTDLGEAVLYSDGATIVGRAGELFENALGLSPGNPKALFYGGMAAIQRGDKELGATRWEALLATSPPPNVQEILRQQIAELRGVSPAPVADVAPRSAGVEVSVSLGAEALAAGLPDTTVFIIARDPLQPSPPIAAVRRRLAELPAVVSIGDSDAMIPGRVPSGFERLEIIARVSLAGQPIAATGDWYGEAIIDTATAGSVNITIDQQVP